MPEISKNKVLSWKIIPYLFLFGSLMFIIQPSQADEEISQRLAGRIVLQVENVGEAWYINPVNHERYSLGHPQEAFELMEWLGVGISNENLDKIPVGLIELDDADNDQDGLGNRLETALGTDPEKKDTDADGFPDKTEIEAGYNPLRTEKANLDDDFTDLHLGKIFLQVEGAGEAWYIDPITKKRYYLGRPSDAFAVMRQHGLGITNQDLIKMTANYDWLPSEPKPVPPPPEPPPCTDCPASTHSTAVSLAADAFRDGTLSRIKLYFHPNLHKSIEYTLDNFSAEQRLLFGNILSSAKLVSATANTAEYSAPVFFSLGDFQSANTVLLEKLENGNWVISSL